MNKQIEHITDYVEHLNQQREITMKFIKSVVLAAALVAPLAHSEVTAEDVCETVDQLAEVIMQNRQLQVPLSKMMGMMEGDGTDINAVLVRELLVIAYNEPAYSTEAYQKRAIAKFRNTVYLSCLQNIPPQQEEQ